MVRDGGVPGEHISILEATPLFGGSLDGAGDPVVGYSLRGGRMLTTDNYECTWDLYKLIPSLTDRGKTVFEETVGFNQKHLAHSMPDRPLPVPRGSKKFAFMSQFLEIADDVVFTVE